MTDVRVYLSFDLEHDPDLRDRLVAQAESAVFAVSSRTAGGDMSEAWQASARARISSCDAVVVMCGAQSDESARMSVELEIAREQDKPCVLLWGRRESMCKKPRGARADDAIYSWAPDILEHQLKQVLRRSREPQLPAGAKRQLTTP